MNRREQRLAPQSATASGLRFRRRASALPKIRALVDDERPEHGVGVAQQRTIG